MHAHLWAGMRRGAHDDARTARDAGTNEEPLAVDAAQRDVRLAEDGDGERLGAAVDAER